MDGATASTLNPAELDQPAINTMCLLPSNEVQKSNRGHPGLPMVAAPMAYERFVR